MSSIKNILDRKIELFVTEYMQASTRTKSAVRKTRYRIMNYSCYHSQGRPNYARVLTSMDSIICLIFDANNADVIVRINEIKLTSNSTHIRMIPIKNI